MSMALMAKWSPDFLFREVPGPSTAVRFLYPSRLVASAFFFAAALGLALLAAWYSRLSYKGLSVSLSLETIIAGLFVGAMAVLSIRAIWDQRVLLVDASARELRLLRRIPFRTRLQTVDFSQLKTILLLDPNPSDPSLERNHHVSLLTDSGTEIFLGKESRSTAIAFCNRLSGLIGIPVERSMSGT